MAKDISKTLTLKDGVSGTLNKVSAGTVRYKKNLYDLKRQGDDTWKGLKRGVVGVAAAVTSYLGVRSLISASNGAAEAAKTQLEAETKLTVIMKQRMGATNDVVKSVVELAAAQEQLGVVSADAQVAGAQELATYLEKSSSLKKLIPVMNDLVAQQYGVSASAEQVTGMATMLGKVMDGQVGALSRYGFTFSKAEENILKFGNEEQRVVLLTQLVRDSLGDMNAALGQTDQGKIKQASDAIGGLKAVVGRTVIFTKAQFARAFMDRLPAIQTGVQGVADHLQRWATNGGIQNTINGLQRIGREIINIWNISVKTYAFFKSNWSLIGPIVYGIAAGFTAYKISVTGAAVATVLFGKNTTFAAVRTAVMGTVSMVAAGQIGVLTAAQRLLNAAWNANPIGVVITAIGLLTTAGIYLVKNWEQVKLAGMQTWNTLVDAAQWGVNKYFDYCNFMFRVYKVVWDSIKYAGAATWNFLVQEAEDGVNKHIEVGNSIIKTFNYVWGVVEHGGKSIWNGVISAAESGIKKLIGPVNSFLKALDKDQINIDFGTYKAKTEMPKWSDMGDVIPSLDFGVAKVAAEAPKWDSEFTILPKVDFGKAKFSEDSIMIQTQKAKAERDKKVDKSIDKLVSALEENSYLTSENNALTSENNARTEENTSATKANTSKLKDNLSPMELADSLLGRIERHVWGT